MSRVIGAEIAVKTLESEGVEVIFGIPGGAMLPFYDKLYDSNIRRVLARHEQSAAHMADGYARISGRPGICVVTSGPGATNTITGIANAYMDSSPIIVITGQVPVDLMGKGAFQEVDMVGMATHITKWATIIDRVEKVEETIRRALKISMNARPGPVLIDFPKDVQTELHEYKAEKAVKIPTKSPQNPKPEQIYEAVKILLNSERPVILAGGGIRWAKAYRELMEVAEMLQAPVATTLMGKGSFPEVHPLSLGCVGMHGNPEAYEVIQEADALLVVGARFSDRTTSKLDEFARDAKIIHIDVDPAEIGKLKKPMIGIVSSADKALKKILEGIRIAAEKIHRSEWLRKVKEIKEIWRERIKGSGILSSRVVEIFKAMREALPPNTIITTEVGQNQMWAQLFWKVIEPGTFISSGGLGTMGFGFPAAIGAKVAKPSSPVVDVAGDGSFMMVENNLGVISKENIAVIVMILDNRMLGMVAQWQRLFYNRRYSSTDLGEFPDFVKLAEAYGVEGVRTDDPEELKSILRRAVRADQPIIIDVPISREENVLPFIPPGRSFREVILSRRYE